MWLLAIATTIMPNGKKFGGRNGKIDNLQEWREHVLRECNNRCCLTNLSRELYRLEAHHLEDKSTHPSLALDVKNGIALIRPLHVNFHEYMGGFHTPTSKKDFEKWRNLPQTKKLITKYKKLGEENNTPYPIGEAKEIQYIKEPKKKRTINGNYIKKAGDKRYLAQSKDQVHQELRKIKSLFNKEVKKLSKFKSLFYFVLVVLALSVLGLYVNSRLKYVHKAYYNHQTFLYIEDKKICFGIDNRQEECLKDNKESTIKQLGDLTLSSY